MTLQEIEGILIVEPGEDNPHIQARYELAYQYTLELIKEHMCSVDTEYIRSDMDIDPYFYNPVNRMPLCVDLNKLCDIRIIFYYDDRGAVMDSFRKWEVPASTVTVHPIIIVVDWELSKPIMVENANSNIITESLFKMLKRAGVKGFVDVHKYYQYIGE